MVTNSYCLFTDKELSLAGESKDYIVRILMENNNVLVRNIIELNQKVEKLEFNKNFDPPFAMKR